MRERPTLRPNEPGEAPGGVVARALTILEEETRAWTALREHRLARSREAVRSGEAVESDPDGSRSAP